MIWYVGLWNVTKRRARRGCSVFRHPLLARSCVDRIMENTRVPLYDVEKSATPKTVCVTGATGFIAGSIVQRLLASGHTVHATCRDPNKEASVAHLKQLAGADERLKLFRADLLTEGSFNEAVAGCSCVMHTASPFVTSVPKGKEREMLIEPALKGTENVIGEPNQRKGSWEGSLLHAGLRTLASLLGNDMLTEP